MTYYNKSLFAFLFFAGFMLAPPAQAQIHEVKQTVFGMDCAPCAYGLEKRFKNIEGVSAATVSLNEGYARVELAPGSTVTLETIRRAVRESGFSPEDATVRVTGTLAQEQGAWVLVLPEGDRFVLEPADDRATLYEQLETGRVTLMGRITQDREPFRNAYTLALLAIEEHS